MQSPEFITLTKKDKDFKRYLLGTFSSEKRAIPTESFGVGSERERVTFQLRNVSAVKKPSWLYVYYKSIRPELLGLTLGHSVVAVFAIMTLFAKHDVSISLNSLDFLKVLTLTLLGVVLTHASGCLFNDFRDHMKGVDRRSVSKGSQVIQKGWCRAADVRRWAVVNAVLAAAIGIHVFWGQWLLFGTLLGLSAAAILLHSWMIPFWNRLGAGDFWIAFLFGPLLFFSVGLAILSPLYLKPSDYPLEFWRDVLILSVALGLMASWTLQVRQLQGIFRMTGEGFRTVVARFNFDQAKKFLWFESLFFIGFQIFALYTVWPTPQVLVVMPLVLPFLLHFNWKLYALKSPLSSGMEALGQAALRVHGALLILWMVCIWSQ